MEDSRRVRIIIAGGRDFADYQLLSESLTEIFRKYSQSTEGGSYDIEIISGTCKGADILGEQFAQEHNYDVVRFPAYWDKYGKSAGYRRNCEMAKYASEAKQSILTAFWDGKSKGTKNMIDIAKRYGLYVHIINY